MALTLGRCGAEQGELVVTDRVPLYEPIRMDLPVEELAFDRVQDDNYAQ